MPVTTIVRTKRRIVKIAEIAYSLKIYGIGNDKTVTITHGSTTFLR